MKITIQKYLKPTDPSKSSNLFSGNLTFVDEIILERHLKAAFPIFKSEYYYQDNVMHLKAGDFNIKISALLTETSEAENKNIYNFFGQVEPTEEGREKYFILCEVTPLNKPCGIVQVDTLESSERDTLVTFNVIGIEKELVAWMDSVMLRSMSSVPGHDHDMPWETEYLPYHHFMELNPAGKTFIYHISDLNIDARVGAPVNVEYEIQDSLFDGGLNQGHSVWLGLKSFMITWGFRFIVQFASFYGNQPRFTMRLKWRSDYVNDVGVIDKFIDKRKGIQIKETKWLFIQTGQVVESGPEADYYLGILFNNYYSKIGEVWNPFNPNTRIGYNVNKRIFQFDDHDPLPAERVEIIAPSFHAQSWLTGVYPPIGTHFPLNIAYARIVNENFGNILLQATQEEYEYLLEGQVARRHLIISVNNIDVVVGTKAIIDGKPFICERINSYDDFNKKMDCEWRQIPG